MKKLFITLAIASLAVSSAQMASYSQTVISPGGQQPATAPSHHNYFEHKHHKDNLQKKLKLTSEQKKQVDAMNAQSREKMKPLIDQKRAERQKIKAMKQTNANPNDIAAEKQKINAIDDQIEQIHKQNLANFESVLTPEQKKKFEKMKKEKHKHHHHHHDGQNWGKENGEQHNGSNPQQ